MNKSKKITLFLTILALLLFPVLTRAEYHVPPPLNINSIETIQPNGGYIIYVFQNNKWQEAGTLTFDKFFREREIDLSRYVSGGEEVKVRLVQKGGGAAHIDSVFLGGEPPVHVTNVENGLKKLYRKDFDVIDAFGKDITVVFPEKTKGKTLSLTARVESTVIGKTPFQFPTENLFKKMDTDSKFYTYKMNPGNDISYLQPIFKEYSRTGSGHPSGYTYGWVSNDDKNLYVKIDFTPDNTMDGGKDYAKVYIKTENGLKEFKESVDETRWGNPAFTYTDKVQYQHKVYDFQIPLKELAINKLKKGRELSLAFSAYGTALPARDGILFPYWISGGGYATFIQVINLATVDTPITGTNQGKLHYVYVYNSDTETCQHYDDVGKTTQNDILLYEVTKAFYEGTSNEQLLPGDTTSTSPTLSSLPKWGYLVVTHHEDNFGSGHEGELFGQEYVVDLNTGTIWANNAINDPNEPNIFGFAFFTNAPFMNYISWLPEPYASTMWYFFPVDGTDLSLTGGIVWDVDVWIGREGGGVYDNNESLKSGQKPLMAGCWDTTMTPDGYAYSPIRRDVSLSEESPVTANFFYTLPEILTGEQYAAVKNTGGWTTSVYYAAIVDSIMAKGYTYKVQSTNILGTQMDVLLYEPHFMPAIFGNINTNGTPTGSIKRATDGVYIIKSRLDSYSK
jgi:hypothetical protein